MSYETTPVKEIRGIREIDRAGIRLLVKREDMNHRHISGNKWWKLKYNMIAAKDHGGPILTFGGAWSNHIYATAAAAAEADIPAIGLIRGEASRELTPTLQFARDKGMELHFVERSRYREKNEPAFQEELKRKFGYYYLIPEGGTNELAIAGCEEFAFNVLRPIAFDQLFLAVGTGGTLAGMVTGFAGDRKITGVSVLKGGQFLSDAIATMVYNRTGRSFTNWKVLTDYHLGGYAKSTPDQLRFIAEARQRFSLPLDHVYTSKALLAVLAEAARGSFKRGETILLLHTGGLQGSQHLHETTAP